MADHLQGCKRGRPLKQAIQECELRWFHETCVAAADGEANQMALLGHMYTVGYGCKPDPEQASKWFAEASKRLGYNVLTDQPPLMSSVGPAAQHQQHQQHQQHLPPSPSPPPQQQYQQLLQQQQQQQQWTHQPLLQPPLQAVHDLGLAGSSGSSMFQFTSGTGNSAAAAAATAAAAAGAPHQQKQQQPASGATSR